jgi:hypothetical protein
MQYKRTTIYCHHLLVQFLITTDDPHSYCSLSFSLSPHTHTGGRGTALPILDPNTGWGWAVNATPWLLYPGKEMPYLLYRKLSGYRKYFLHRGLNPGLAHSKSLPCWPHSPPPLHHTHMHKHTKNRLIHYELAAVH